MAAVPTDDRKRVLRERDGDYKSGGDSHRAPHPAKRLRMASSMLSPMPATPIRRTRTSLGIAPATPTGTPGILTPMQRSRPERPEVPTVSRLKALPATPASTSQPTPAATPTPATPTRTPATSHPPQDLPSSAKIIPDVPLLYDTALSAHAAAASHYQQAFVPLGVQIPTDGEEDVKGKGKGAPPGVSPIPLYRDGAEETFVHDPAAGNTALRLLVLALDLLGLGLAQRGLSDKERAAFGLEFATVGLKLAHAATVIGQMKNPQRALLGIEINTTKLYEDLGTVVTKSLAVARRGTHLKHYAHGLELASFQLAVLKDRGSQAIKILKQTLAATPADEYQHRYTLQLQHMGYLRDTGSHEFFKVALNLQKEAAAAGHTEFVQLVLLARLRGHFDLRKWDSLGETLSETEAALGLEETPAIDQLQNKLQAIVLIHYYQFKALHTARLGQQAAAKAALLVLYNMMDVMIDKGISSELRLSGAVLKIKLRAPSQQTQYLYIQTTPVNVLYSLTYLNSMVSRRSFFMDAKACRTLVHARAMREFEKVAKMDDMWDCGFSVQHGIGDALQLQQTIMTLRVEGMMEQALALICRSAFEEADTLLTGIVHVLRASNLLHTHMPHITLLYAQFAHYMGRPEVAERYYRAAKHSLVPGSELQVLVEIGLLGATGKLQGLKESRADADPVNALADICRSGSNAQLHAVGNFISSLTDVERLMSKRKLSASYDVACKGDMNMIYSIIFAFTTAAHIYGDRDKQFKQLSTGRHVAHILGGMGRKDKVGQATLGLWFERKLQEHYRLQGMAKEEKASQKAVDAHIARINEVYQYSLERFPLPERDSDVEGQVSADE